MMDVAASGGYYVALPADFILAHPTTITGSIGVAFMRPKVTGLMEKIGLEMEVNKSGKNKDIGSPFREATKEEQKILQGLTDGLGERFLNLVAKHRKLDKNALQDIATARVYLSDEALQHGLVDKVGYLDEAVSKAANLAGLSEDAKVVVYRRTRNFPPVSRHFYCKSGSKSKKLSPAKRWAKWNIGPIKIRLMIPVWAKLSSITMPNKMNGPYRPISRYFCAALG
jgi:ClpP class serine protease